jgi:hypothetical protein
MKIKNALGNKKPSKKEKKDKSKKVGEISESGESLLKDTAQTLSHSRKRKSDRVQYKLESVKISFYTSGFRIQLPILKHGLNHSYDKIEISGFLHSPNPKL